MLSHAHSDVIIPIPLTSGPSGSPPRPSRRRTLPYPSEILPNYLFLCRPDCMYPLRCTPPAPIQCAVLVRLRRPHSVPHFWENSSYNNIFCETIRMGGRGTKLWTFVPLWGQTFVTETGRQRNHLQWELIRSSTEWKGERGIVRSVVRNGYSIN